MNRAALALLLVGPTLSGVLAGCDDQDKKKAELIARTGGSASAVATPQVASASPVASAAAPAKPPKECPTGSEVPIDDPDLEAGIRAKLNKPKETDPTLTVKDLVGVTSLRINATKPLAELDPCVYPKLVALRFLYLPKGTYRDLTPLASLTKLEGLFFPDSEVDDLKPLEKLVLLDQLGFNHAPVKDITPLGNLVNLTELTLDDTPVSDLGALAKCTKLEKLSIKNTLVTDVSPLKDLKKLKTLSVRGTALTNLDVLEPLKTKGLKIQL